MIKGSIVALVTPMTETGAVDYLGLEQMIAFHLKEQNRRLTGPWNNWGITHTI